MALQDETAVVRGRLALVLDENRDGRASLTAMLTHAGLRTAAVSNFSDARQAISQQRMMEEVPVVFVSSSFAPDGTAEIRGLLADVPPPIVIVICAEHGGARCRLFDTLPCGEYMRCMCKPFTYQQLLQTIKAMLVGESGEMPVVLQNR
jgi:DNA-binding NtrC family response regulator